MLLEFRALTLLQLICIGHFVFNVQSSSLDNILQKTNILTLFKYIVLVFIVNPSWVVADLLHNFILDHAQYSLHRALILGNHILFNVVIEFILLQELIIWDRLLLATTTSSDTSGRCCLT